MSSDTSAIQRADLGSIHALLDELAGSYAGPGYKDQIAEAREDYFTRSGKVFEDDAEVHEARTVAFLEWYVIERPLVEGKPPVIHALEKAQADGAPGTRLDALVRLATSHRSLFDIAHVDDNAVELEDVLGGARFRVTERRSTIGFEVGSLVEARLVWEGAHAVFSKTFLFHPRDARSQVLDIVDDALAAGVDHDEILFRLAQLYLRWHRHGHNNAARIYKGGSVTQGPVPL